MSMGESSSSFFSNPTASMDRSSAMMQSIVFRAFGGFVLMIIGKSISNVGAKGLAGSGVILDPEQARQELEPHSRMAGGIIKDTLEEANINLSGVNSGHAEKLLWSNVNLVKNLMKKTPNIAKNVEKKCEVEQKPLLNYLRNSLVFDWKNNLLIEWQQKQFLQTIL